MTEGGAAGRLGLRRAPRAARRAPRSALSADARGRPTPCPFHDTIALLTALTAGFVHALEADHRTAVTTFVSRRPRPLEAPVFGLRWGLGHSAAIVVLGGLESGWGALLGLGLWLLFSAVLGVVWMAGALGSGS